MPIKQSLSCRRTKYSGRVNTKWFSVEYEKIEEGIRDEVSDFEDARYFNSVNQIAAKDISGRLELWRVAVEVCSGKVQTELH